MKKDPLLLLSHPHIPPLAMRRRHGCAGRRQPPPAPPLSSAAPSPPTSPIPCRLADLFALVLQSSLPAVTLSRLTHIRASTRGCDHHGLFLEPLRDLTSSPTPVGWQFVAATPAPSILRLLARLAWSMWWSTHHSKSPNPSPSPASMASAAPSGDGGSDNKPPESAPASLDPGRSPEVLVE